MTQLHQKEDPPVTVVVSRQVKPGCEAAFEEVISGITAAAMTYEGHLGTNIFRPSDPQDREYKIIFKFDRASNLRRWEESECRRILVFLIMFVLRSVSKILLTLRSSNLK